MRIHIVNPNATASMTAGIARAAEAASRGRATIEAVTNADGPPAVEGPVDGAMAVPGVLRAIAAAEARRPDERPHAHIIACFDDTGLAAARAVATAPVLGIGEAGAHVACLLARRFAIVTTLACSVPVLQDNLRLNGLDARCSGVYASDLPVLALEADPQAAEDQVSEAIGQALAQGAEAIVLGCAGMADFAARLSKRNACPVIDGVAAAIGLAETLVSLGATSAKVGAYAAPSRMPLAR